MPKYGLNKFGRFKYGKYILSSGGGGNHSLGPHVRYRIRNISPKGKASEFLTMCEDRVGVKGKANFRIRSERNEWVYIQNEIIEADAVKVRIRSIEKDSGKTEWVYADRGSLYR